MSKMCQACWVTPAKRRVVCADGIKRWRCNGCIEKRNPKKAQTPREALEAKIFRKDNV